MSNRVKEVLVKLRDVGEWTDIDQRNFLQKGEYESKFPHLRCTSRNRGMKNGKVGDI